MASLPRPGDPPGEMTKGYAHGLRSAPGRLADVTVAEAMHAGVVSCPRGATMRAVARVLAGHRIHAAVVELPEGGWGVVSDLDLVAAVARGEAPGAAELAGSPAATVGPGESLEAAVLLMHERGVTHLVVVDAALERPVGVLSTLDVADVVAELGG
jgi:CBS domain-containing protein